MALIADGSSHTVWSHHAVGGDSTTRITHVTTPAPPSGGSANSIRFDIRDGEAYFCTSCDRCEVSSGGLITFAQGVDYWWEWWYRFDSTWPAAASPNTDWNIVMQVHLTASSVLGTDTQPILILTTAPGDILRLKTSQGKGQTLRWQTTLVRDTWHKFKAHAVFSRSASDGLMEFTYNDTKVVDNLAVAMLPADETTTERPYIKLGCYRSPSYTGNTFGYANSIKFYDADPGGSTPPGSGGSATPAVTAPPDATRLGASTSGTTWSGAGGDSKRGSDWTLADTADVSGIRVYMDGYGNAGSGTATARAFIYDVATLALFATSDEVSVPYETAEGWTLLALPSVVRLNPGTYRIGFISGGTSQVIRYGYTAETGALAWGSDTYSDGLTTAWAAVGTDAKRISAYAVYTAVESEPAPPPQSVPTGDGRDIGVGRPSFASGRLVGVGTRVQGAGGGGI